MIIKRDKTTFQHYLTDASNYPGNAEMLYIPESKEELEELMGELYSKNISFTLRGAGTSTTGSSAPLSTVVVSLEKLNQIIEFIPEKGTLKCMPGVTLADIDNFAKSHNLFYPVNPTETDATIGGTVATNASGARTYKYGTTIDNLVSISMPDFSDSKPVPHTYMIENKYDMSSLKSAVGYRPEAVAIGSEGTLGVITEATIQLRPLPANVLGLYIFFDDENNMLNFVDAVRDQSLSREPASPRLDARLVEYFDRKSLEIIRNDFPAVPGFADSCIWIEQEYKDEEEDTVFEKWFELIENHTAYADNTIAATDESKHKEFAAMRHAIPTYINELTARAGTVKKATDTAVPHSEFRKHFAFMSNILSNSSLNHISFGHIGNSHVHTNFLPKDTREVEKAQDLNRKIIEHAIECGGTVSAEHGIGKIKKEYFKMMLSPSRFKEMEKIKRQYDAKGLASPGNIF